MPAFPDTVGNGIRGLRFEGPGNQTYFIPATDNEPDRNTYRAFAGDLAPSGTVNDLVVLGGSATRLIRLKSVILSGAATNATNVIVSIFRRTAAYTGGTPTAIARTSADTQDPASTASLVHYATAAATAGAGTLLDGCRLNLAPAANGSIDRPALQYTWQNDKAACLRGVNEFFGIGLNGATMPAGGRLDVSLTWTEE